MIPSTKPKPFVFVLMPFSPEFDDVYQLGIKPACNNAGAYAERVDEQIFRESILERIYNQIDKADIILSDMTGKNPNVFYETGYAHALGKPVVLLTQNSDDIPFDLKHYPHIIYKGRITDLIPEIEKRVKYLIDNPPEKSLQFINELELYVNGQRLQDESKLVGNFFNYESNRLKFRIDIHNPVKIEIKLRHCQIGLETSETFNSCTTMGKPYRDEFGNPNMIKQPSGRILYIYGEIFEILPGAWKSLFYDLRHFPAPEKIDINKETLTFEIYSDNGASKFNFMFAENAGQP